MRSVVVLLALAFFLPLVPASAEADAFTVAWPRVGDVAIEDMGGAWYTRLEWVGAAESIQDGFGTTRQAFPVVTTIQQGPQDEPETTTTFVEMGNERIVRVVGPPGWSSRSTVTASAIVVQTVEQEYDVDATTSLGPFHPALFGFAGRTLAAGDVVEFAGAAGPNGGVRSWQALGFAEDGAFEVASVDGFWTTTLGFVPGSSFPARFTYAFAHENLTLSWSVPVTFTPGAGPELAPSSPGPAPPESRDAVRVLLTVDGPAEPLSAYYPLPQAMDDLRARQASWFDAHPDAFLLSARLLERPVGTDPDVYWDLVVTSPAAGLSMEASIGKTILGPVAEPGAYLRRVWVSDFWTAETPAALGSQVACGQAAEVAAWSRGGGPGDLPRRSAYFGYASGEPRCSVLVETDERTLTGVHLVGVHESRVLRGGTVDGLTGRWTAFIDREAVRTYSVE